MGLIKSEWREVSRKILCFIKAVATQVGGPICENSLSCELTIFALRCTSIKRKNKAHQECSQQHYIQQPKMETVEWINTQLSLSTERNCLHTAHALATTWMESADIILSKLKPSTKGHTGWFCLFSLKNHSQYFLSLII